MAVLYGDGELFACRSCYNLAYECQSENPFTRSIRLSQKIRMRLGGTPDPFWSDSRETARHVAADL